LPSFWGFCPLFWGFCPLFEDTDRIWLWAFTIRKEIFEYKKPCSSCGMFTYCPHFQESTVGGSTVLECCPVECLFQLRTPFTEQRNLCNSSLIESLSKMAIWPFCPVPKVTNSILEWLCLLRPSFSSGQLFLVPRLSNYGGFPVDVKIFPCACCIHPV
jgi:hypothetical protein